MAGAQFTIPLITVIPGQLITAALWNNEFNNLSVNLNPAGLDGYSDTDAQMQIQTAPYPSSVTSHASNLGGELERIRFQLSAFLGATTPPFWYAKPPIDLTTVSNAITPLGAIIEYPSATPPNANFLVANGQAIGRTFYVNLFTLIGTTFGTGDGTTTFNIPNLTDRMTITAGNLYALAATGGAVNQTLAKNQIPSGLLTLTDPGHTHGITDPQHSHGVSDPGHSHTIASQAGSSNTAALSRLGTGATTNATSTNSATTGLTVNSASTGITGANSNTTGISLTDNGGSVPVSTLSPYFGLYKMMRVL